MSPITHFLTGWVLANSAPSLSTRERAIVTLAGVLPDMDGLGVLPDLLTRNSAHPLDWFSRYHHQLHNLGFAAAVAVVGFALAHRKRWLVMLLAFASFHLHLIEDLLGGRGPDGYQWPIPYFSPFSQAVQFTWSGQWPLNAWPNFVFTICLLVVTLYLAWSKGYSPLEMISARADHALVAALRHRFPRVAPPV